MTSSYDLFKLKMLPALRECFEYLLRVGRFWNGDRLIELKNPDTGRFEAKTQTDPMWGRIILRSAESGGGLESSTAKAAWLDEAGMDAFTLETWEAVLRRLSLSRGRVLLTTTPYVVNWLKTEIHDRWQEGHPDYDVIQFESSLNPAFPRAEQERARATMPLWRYRMFYRGEFARPAGMIYDCWDEEIHVVPGFEVPPHWPHYAGVDFGGVNTAILWVAEDTAAGRYFVYDESLEGGQSTREHALAAQQRVRGQNLVACWGGAKSEDQQRRDWAERGFPVREPPVWEVEAGIDRVYALLKEKRLFVFAGCRGLRDEFGSYRRKLDAAGLPTEEIVDKRTFHRCLAGGTQIATPSGDVPIEQLKCGDEVLTPVGPRPVLEAGMTAERAALWELTCDDGRTLIGTGEHPVYVEGRGHIPLQALRYGDTVQVTSSRMLKERSSWRKSEGMSTGRSWSIRVFASIATRTRSISPVALTSPLGLSTVVAGLSRSIGKSGRTRTARYPRAMKFITVMATRSTTLWRIWTACLTRSIRGTMRRTPRRNCEPHVGSILTLSDRWQLHGTGHPPAGNGTRKRQSGHGWDESRQPISVNTAAAVLYPGNRATSGSARQTAKPHNEGLTGRTTRIGRASSAGALSVAAGSAFRSIAHVRALAKPAAVYNLTVADTHEFYANGIRVHNCDALRYLASGLSRQAPGRPVVGGERPVIVAGVLPGARQGPLTRDQVLPGARAGGGGRNLGGYRP